MDSMLLVSSSPHLHCGMTTKNVMRDVLIALLPALLASVWLFGPRTLAVVAVSTAAAVAAEYLSRIVMKRPQTVGDGSAAVTGVLLAMNLPPTIPLWEAVLGSVVAVVVAKQLFGGLGQNFVNPALVGRIVLMASFPTDMNTWTAPLKFGWATRADAVTSATPLALLSGEPSTVSDPLHLFFGINQGCLGETCVAALLLGGIYLVIRRVISPLIPLTYIGTVFVLTWLLGSNPVVHILSGGLMLGAVFMATDYVTCPISNAGKVVYAVGCGLITVLIRLYGSLPEGVSFAIVIMNILTPLIERFTAPRPFGEKRKAVRS